MTSTSLDLSELTRGGVDRVSLEERAARFQKRSVKSASQMEALKTAIALSDLTTLEGADTPGRVRRLCQKAIRPDVARPGLPSVAAVCVYPELVAVAAQELKGSGVRVASVATGFPAGQTALESRLGEVSEAVLSGADEIDMVISRNAFLRGDLGLVADEIELVKSRCGEAHLKVILETGELGSYASVRLAALLACEAGADFVKTSTGKISPAANMPVTLVLLEAVRDFYEATGRRVGVKPAGGIRTAKQAVHYLVMLRETLGEEYLSPELFRFGASSLLNDLLMQIAHLESGAYQAKEYFSDD